MFNRVAISMILLLSLTSNAFAQPVNDNWSDRILISPAQLAAGFSDAQNLMDATTESTDPSIPCKVGDPTQRGNTIWYELTTGPDPVYVRMATGTSFNALLSIYTGVPGAFERVVGGCNDDGAANFGVLLDGLRLAPNRSYAIMVARSTQSSGNPSPLVFTAALAGIKRVTKTADTNDGDCSVSDCSLREAIQTPGGGAIELPAGDYALTLVGSSENAGNSGDLDIYKGLFIYGASAATTRISTALSDRLIDLDSTPSLIGATVGLVDITLSGGNAGFGFGGCINAPTSDGGAGQANEYLVLIRAVVTGCSTQLGGGGIASPSSPMHLFESTISNNTAASGGGGILFSQSAAAPVAQGLIERSTISGNTSTAGSSDGGGGILARGSVVLLASTVSGNRARFNGGGILVSTFNGRISILDSTIANNNSDSDGNGSGIGGGIRFDTTASSATTFQIFNSVFAGNFNGAAPGLAQDCHASANTTVIASNRSFYQEPDASCALTASPNFGNVIGGNPMLGALAANGGPTQTHLPMSGSLLIDNSNSLCLQSIDQRGVARPADGDGNLAVQCDMGAVEVAPLSSELLFANGFE